MKLSSWNVNGIRAAHKNGFLDWWKAAKADVVCLQEIKVTEDQLSFDLRYPDGCHSIWFSAKKPGYSGVATLSRTPPDKIQEGMGGEPHAEFDSEGRVLTTYYGKLAVVNAYFPNSQREHTRLDYKLRFCDAIFKYVHRLEKKGFMVVLCGDYNIAHQEIDLRNPKSNMKNAGFLPEERAWMTRFLESGFRDPFREREPGGGHYTWWSYRPGVRDKNVGWRIDYHCVSPSAAAAVEAVGHQPEVMGSDHCPIYLKLDL